MFTEIQEDNLDVLLNQSKKVMVQYGASWCGNCKITKPKFKRMSEEHTDIEFYYVDAEKFPNARQFANVSNLPTFAGFIDGKLIKEAQGNKVEVIQEVLNEVTAN